MANHTNSVFGAGATEIPLLSTTRFYASNAGTDGPKYVTGTSLMEGIPFRPTGKYSPIQIFEFDGYANGQPDNGTPATHDASAGAVPSYTTANRASLCVVTVAGTLGGASVSVGDILIANQDNPTTAAHWDIVTDSTTEFEAAVTAAQGAMIRLDGTYLFKNADVIPRLTGAATILNQCGYSAIYSEANNTVAAVATPRAVTSLNQDMGEDSDLGTDLQHTTYFTLTTAADAADFLVGSKAVVFSDAVHPSEDGSSKGYLSNAFVVTAVDVAAGTVYADRVIRYHNEIANATNKVIVPLREDCAARIDRGIVFMGAPTVIGGEVGWWLTLVGSDPITATISGSGDTRTLTVAGGVPTYLVGQACRIIVDADSTFTMKVTATTATTITGSVPKDGSDYVTDRDAIESAPTSGSVTFVPGFWSSEFNATTHGGALVLQQAHGSVVDCDVYRAWAAGVRLRYSHYCTVTVRGGKSVNIGTDIATRSWRLLYGVEAYSSCRNTIRVFGSGWRHAYTTSGSDTGLAWAGTLWTYRSGCTCENDVYIESAGATGAASDTHAMTNGDRIRSLVLFMSSWDTAHSYRGIGGQARGENHVIDHTQVGGLTGYRIANGSTYARGAGCVDDLTLDVSDLPMNADSHCFLASSPANGQKTPSGLYVQSQSAYTGGAAGERTKFVGEMKLRNAGCGFILESYATGSMKEISHTDVGYAIGWVQDQSKLHVSNVFADYSIGGGVESAHTGGSVALGTGSKSFTITTGLTIPAGSKVLVQDTTSALTPRANFGWGRVVSYDSGTGVIVTNIEKYKGAATVSTWRVTVGVKNPRYGIVMSGTSQFTFDTMHWRVGQGANPTGIFRSRDAAGGKTVTGGVLIITDPNGYGMPTLVEDGREADFTLNIGKVIYNGREVNGTLPIFAYESGRWFGALRYGATSTSGYSATGAGTIEQCTPFTIAGNGVWITDLATVWITNTAATACWISVYEANGAALGALKAQIEVTGIGTSIVAATAVSGTLAAPVFLPPGKYFFGILPNGGVTSMQAISGSSPASQIVGTSDLTDPDGAGARRLERTGLTYGAPPAGPATLTRNASSSTLLAAYFKAQ